MSVILVQIIPDEEAESMPKPSEHSVFGYMEVPKELSITEQKKVVRSTLITLKRDMLTTKAKIHVDSKEKTKGE